MKRHEILVEPGLFTWFFMVAVIVIAVLGLNRMNKSLDKMDETAESVKKALGN